ncbi:hypothetical protein AB0J83_38840 [Actinoplanes sp. NPDC049596]|uniref:hypothetical protein n=1 Tax=unclassified Actinoplanes TaxID=2626549 RepID=UPI0034350F33
MIMVRRAAAVLLLAAVALVPSQPRGAGVTERDPLADCGTRTADGVHVTCSIALEGGVASPDGGERSVAGAPVLPSLRVPRAARLATGGREGCVRGAARPVVGTTRPTLSVVFTDPGTGPIEATFEYQPLGASEDESIMSVVAGQPGENIVLEAGDWGFGPGESYRWRVRGTNEPGTEVGWSPWCEFAVKAGLTDLRQATDVDAVRELGVVPGRRYPVTLTVRQWRLVLDAVAPMDDVAVDDGTLGGESGQAEEGARLRRLSAAVQRRIGAEPATVTLTGDDWAVLAREIAGMAGVAGELHAEEPDVYESDGSPYWRVVDRISVQLGGPAHPTLGGYR